MSSSPTLFTTKGFLHHTFTAAGFGVRIHRACSESKLAGVALWAGPRLSLLIQQGTKPRVYCIKSATFEIIPRRVNLTACGIREASYGLVCSFLPSLGTLLTSVSESHVSLFRIRGYLDTLSFDLGDLIGGLLGKGVRLLHLVRAHLGIEDTPPELALHVFHCQLSLGLYGAVCHGFSLKLRRRHPVSW